LVVSCATHTIPNLTLCADLVDQNGFPDGAYCKELNTDEAVIIPKDEWDGVIRNYIHISVPDVGELVKFIEKVCNRSKCKKKQIQELLDEFFKQDLFIMDSNVL